MTTTEKAILIAKITALLEAELTVTDERQFVHVEEDQDRKVVPFVRSAEIENDTQTRKCIVPSWIVNPFMFSHNPFETYNPFTKDHPDEDYPILAVAFDESKQL